MGGFSSRGGGRGELDIGCSLHIRESNMLNLNTPDYLSKVMRLGSDIPHCGGGAEFEASLGGGL